MNRLKNFWSKGIGPKAIIIGTAVMALSIIVAIFTSVANAAEPSDNGGWSSPQTAQQGFLVQYAPVNPPALVFFWFTHDSAGNQAWFISDNIPTDGGGPEDVAYIYKPICIFADDPEFVDDPENPGTGESACERGDPVGVIAVSDRGSDLMIRFGIREIEGFGPGCTPNLSHPVLPSPVPPAFPIDEYPCQGTLVVGRVWPGIPELEQ